MKWHNLLNILSITFFLCVLLMERNRLIPWDVLMRETDYSHWVVGSSLTKLSRVCYGSVPVSITRTECRGSFLLVRMVYDETHLGVGILIMVICSFPLSTCVLVCNTPWWFLCVDIDTAMVYTEKKIIAIKLEPSPGQVAQLVIMSSCYAKVVSLTPEPGALTRINQ